MAQRSPAVRRVELLETYRVVLTAIHVVCAAATASTYYLFQISVSRADLKPTAWSVVVVRIAWVTWPYLVSQLTTPRDRQIRLRELWLISLVAVVCTMSLCAYFVFQPRGTINLAESGALVVLLAGALVAAGRFSRYDLNN